MTNSLTRTDGKAVSSLLGGENPFLVAANAVGAGGTSHRYARFSGNTGQFTVKDEIIPDQALFAFDVANLRLQWLGWVNGKPRERIEIHLNDDGFEALPPEHELPPLPTVKNTDGWKLYAVFMIRDLDGEFGELEISLPAELNRKFPRPSWRLIGAFGEKDSKEKDEFGNSLIPVVALTSEPFDSPGGIKYAPVLDVDHWLTRAQLDKMAALADASDAEEIDVDDVDDEVPAAKTVRRGARA